MGGAQLIALVEQFAGVEALVRASRGDLERAGLEADSIDGLRRPDAALLARDRAWLDAPGHHLLTFDDERYPALLRDTPSPPAALWVDGDPDVLWQPQIAVIGSRNPTAGGRDNARDFAAELSRRGLAVTSGLASGIDSVAHRAALDAGGYTIAVAGTGLDTVYPASSRSLAERIRGQGALVSEFPLGAPARRHHFPSRNRIISGLSLGVLVIEAGLRSGTLITARLAAGQGREVFALPGSIHNPMAKGCHRLIRDGARLVENADDVLQELASLAGELAGQLGDQLAAAVDDGEAELDMTAASRKLTPRSTGAFPAADERPWETDPDYRALWACLGFDPKPVESIIRQTGLTAPAVSAMLLMLELRGMVEAHPGGGYSRTQRGQ
ncbi:MAG: DNA-processing protein DprA [Xanthomonadales bacterium]